MLLNYGFELICKFVMIYFITSPPRFLSQICRRQISPRLLQGVPEFTHSSLLGRPGTGQLTMFDVHRTFRLQKLIKDLPQLDTPKSSIFACCVKSITYFRRNAQVFVVFHSIWEAVHDSKDEFDERPCPSVEFSETPPIVAILLCTS